MVRLKKPWLYLPPALAHKLSAPFLYFVGHILKSKTPTWAEFNWHGLSFKNPLGTSGGIDKNADFLKAYWSLGAGFIEIGTVTPLAQEANPGVILDRDLHHLALWNKMGFPNKGAHYVQAKLRELKRPYPTPLFVNIGKNRNTPNDKAHEDYLICIRALKNYADAFVVNISSPNTKGLRDLLKPNNLAGLLSPLITELKNEKPLLLKLSPDMTSEELKSALDVSCELGIHGWILTNTTLQREEGLKFSQEGGVSGAPLTALSREMLKKTVEILGDRKKDKLIVSVGGVLDTEEVLLRLRLGAQLVQVYSALIFEGPGFFRKVAREVAKLRKKS